MYGAFSLLNDNYIIEEGSNENGYYRKWSNGTLDMWGTYAFENANINETVGAIYYSSGYTIPLPVTSVTNVRGVSYTLLSNGSAWVTGTNGGNRRSTLGLRLFAGISYRADGAIDWRCTGTWK